ncbi:MAG: hypothetical protein ACI4KM_02795 [Oscillospiraceae bacterium]
MLIAQVLSEKVAECFKRKQIKVQSEVFEGIPMLKLKPDAFGGGKAEIELEISFTDIDGGVMAELFAVLAEGIDINTSIPVMYGLNDLNCRTQIGSYAVFPENGVLFYRYQLHLRSELGSENDVLNSLELALNQIDSDFSPILEMLN